MWGDRHLHSGDSAQVRCDVGKIGRGMHHHTVEIGGQNVDGPLLPDRGVVRYHIVRDQHSAWRVATCTRTGQKRAISGNLEWIRMSHDDEIGVRSPPPGPEPTRGVVPIQDPVHRLELRALGDVGVDRQLAWIQARWVLVLPRDKPNVVPA